MMTDQTEIIVTLLKGLIDKNGPEYLLEKPYDAYKELNRYMGADNAGTAAMLCFLVSGLVSDAEKGCEPEELSKAIQKKCCFNKKMSDLLSKIFCVLYSEENKTEWKAKDSEGLSEFLKQEHTFRWEGCSVWDAGNGTVDCYYDADMVLKPTKEAGKTDGLKSMLKKNPFVTADAIYKFYEKELCKYLDHEFEEYCTCDDYYQPVVEDFELEYDVKAWAKKNGFNVISCNGDGRDEGYEPKFRRGW